MCVCVPPRAIHSSASQRRQLQGPYVRWVFFVGAVSGFVRSDGKFGLAHEVSRASTFSSCEKLTRVCVRTKSPIASGPHQRSRARQKFRNSPATQSIEPTPRKDAKANAIRLAANNGKQLSQYNELDEQRHRLNAPGVFSKYADC